MQSSVVQFLPVAVFTLGAPAFVVLTLFYWRNQNRGGTGLFRFFTAVCAGAFLFNLTSLAFIIDSPVLAFFRAVLVSLLAPLMAHLTLERTAPEPPRLTFWRVALLLLYCVAVISTIGREANIADAFDTAPSFILTVSSALALTMLWLSGLEGNERAWMLSLFAALFVLAAATFFSENVLLEIAPDYLLLLFFSVHLYYSERLAFFDVFLRTGAFGAIGVLVLTAASHLVFAVAGPVHGPANQEWLITLVFIPVWLFAPFLYRHLGLWIDRRLGRRYSTAEAESAFSQKLQEAATEGELTDSAGRILESIFGCEVEIHLASRGNALQEDLFAPLAPAGCVILKSRNNQAPFLSDDRRLLESLSGTLSVMLQNVKLRMQRAELLDLAGRAELRALRAQINPHFLFNALNAVANSIGSKPEAAEDTLARLADVFRYTLSRSDKEWVPLSEEMEFIQAYLAVERARFGPRLEIEVQFDETTRDLIIPTMIVQPLVENAVKHGTARVVGIGRIWINITAHEACLLVTVRDNGPGFPAGFTLDTEAQGHGLRNTRDLLQGHYGCAGDLRWENGPMGAQVSLEIPRGTRQRCAS
jgi:signal transduction histidine kinase